MSSEDDQKKIEIITQSEAEKSGDTFVDSVIYAAHALGMNDAQMELLQKARAKAWTAGVSWRSRNDFPDGWSPDRFNPFRKKRRTLVRGDTNPCPKCGAPSLGAKGEECLHCQIGGDSDG